MDRFISNTNLISISRLVEVIEEKYIDLRAELIKTPNRYRAREQSHIIEKILLGLPLPPIVIGEHKYGQQIIISGNLIAQSITDFINDQWALEELLYKRELNGVKYSSLSFREKRSLLESNLYLIEYWGNIKPLDKCIVYREANKINGNHVAYLEQKIREVCFETGHRILTDLTDYVVMNSYLINDERFRRTSYRSNSHILTCLVLYLYQRFDIDIELTSPLMIIKDKVLCLLDSMKVGNTFFYSKNDTHDFADNGFINFIDTKLYINRYLTERLLIDEYMSFGELQSRIYDRKNLFREL